MAEDPEQVAEGPAAPEVGSADPPSPAAVRSSGRGLGGIDLRLIPDEIETQLVPHPVGPSPERLRPLWHVVTPRSSALVSLTSRDKRIRLIRLSVRSEAPRWGVKWPRWILVVRRPPELMGGDAIAAQDADRRLPL